jgi:hypothetical protein
VSALSSDFVSLIVARWLPVATGATCIFFLQSNWVNLDYLVTCELVAIVSALLNIGGLKPGFWQHSSVNKDGFVIFHLDQPGSPSKRRQVARERRVSILNQIYDLGRDS